MFETYIIVPLVYLIVSFVIVFKLQEKAKGTRLEKPVLVLFVIPFVIFDWLMNLTVFTVVCLDLPERFFEISTDRFKRYKRVKSTRWQLAVATFFCKLANTVDKEHC